MGNHALAGLHDLGFSLSEKFIHSIDGDCIKCLGHLLVIGTVGFYDQFCLMLPKILHPYGGCESAYSGKYLGLSHLSLHYLFSIIDALTNIAGFQTERFPAWETSPEPPG